MGLVGLALYLLYLGGVLAALFRRPLYGLYVLVPLLPLQNVRYRLHDYPLGAQCIDLLLAAVALGLLFRGKKIFPESPFSGLFAKYVTFTYLSLWMGVLFIGSDLPLFFNNERLADWKNIMVMYLLYFLVVAAAEKRRDLIVLLALMVFAIVLVDKNYYSGVSGRDTSAFSWERFAGVMGFVGANGVGAFQAQAFGAFLAMWGCAKKLVFRWGYLALTAASAYCVLFAYSRGAYVAVLIVWLFVGVLKKRVLIILFAAFLVSWQTFVPPSVIERVTMTVGEDGQLESSSADRVNMWEDALEVFRTDPLFGTGFHTYAFMGRHYKNAHNLYIQTLVETGVFGLLLLIYMFFRYIRYGLRMHRSLSDPLFSSVGFAFAAWTVGVMGANLFGVRIIYVEVYSFTLVTLGVLVRAEQLQYETEAAADAEDVPAESLEVAPAAAY